MNMVINANVVGFTGLLKWDALRFAVAPPPRALAMISPLLHHFPLSWHPQFSMDCAQNWHTSLLLGSTRACEI